MVASSLPRLGQMPDRATIRFLLTQLLKSRGPLAREVALRDLAVALALDAGETDAAFAEHCLTQAVSELPRAFHHAAESLLLDPMPLKMRARQELAGTVFGVGWETFRKRYQDQCLDVIAERLELSMGARLSQPDSSLSSTIGSGAPGAAEDRDPRPSAGPMPGFEGEMLGAAGWTAYQRGLALSLINLSDQLAERDQGDEAVSAITEAVEIYRRLAITSPAEYEPPLASSLNSLSLRLADLDRDDEALEAVSEAVDIYRRLATKTVPDP